MRKTSRLRTAPAPVTAETCGVRLAITREEAARLAECVTADIQGEPDDLARFLLLCHALTYTREIGNRESLLTAVEAAVAPYLTAFDAMLHAEQARVLAGLRGEGGAQ